MERNIISGGDVLYFSGSSRMNRGADSSSPSKMISTNGQVFFSVNYNEDGHYGTAILSTDGTEKGTEVVTREGGILIRSAGKYSFFENNDRTYVNIWFTDGTGDGTKLLKARARYTDSYMRNEARYSIPY